MKKLFLCLIVSFIYGESLCQKINILTQHGDKILFVETSRNNSRIIEYSDTEYKITESSLNELIPEKWRDGIHTIYFDKKDNLWIGSGKNLVKYENGNFTAYNKDNGLEANYMSFPYEDSKGRIWFSSILSKQIAFYENGVWKSFDIKGGSGIPFQGYRIAEDEKGNVILGAANGIYHFNGESFDVFNKDTKYPYKLITDVRKDSKGNLWFGCEGYGIAMLSQNNEWKNYTKKEGYPSKNISISVDSNNVIWFCGEDKISKFVNENMQIIEVDNSLVGDIMDFAIDSEQNLWIVSEKSKVSKYDGSQWTQYAQILDSLNKENKTALTIPELRLFTDKENNVWFFKHREYLRYHRLLKIENGVVKKAYSAPIRQTVIMDTTKFTEKEIGDLNNAIKALDTLTSSAFVKNALMQGVLDGFPSRKVTESEIEDRYMEQLLYTIKVLTGDDSATSGFIGEHIFSGVQQMKNGDIYLLYGQGGGIHKIVQ